MDKATNEKLTIAEQVIVSASNILAATGFNRQEIQAFFQQAADHLADGQAAKQKPSSASDPLQAEFRSSAVSQKLAELAARQAALPPLDSSHSALRDHFDITMQMIPLISEAQEWLRRAAKNAGRQFAADREIADALTLQGDTVFLADFADPLGASIQQVGHLCEALVASKDAEALTFVLSFLTDNGVIITRELAEAIHHGLGRLERQPAASDTPL